MIIRSLTATFGCLDNKTLDLGEGLNLITAPNEAGKSTWSAFIRTILYGISTRERGELADKNKFAPWNGKAMHGRLDCSAEGQEITVIRDTVRQTAPMGRFFASFAGTAEQVPWLSGADAGEALTGVPREVFERSAFIRQSGLAIDQDSELERRIAALISSGEEDTSYSEAYARLKDQLNKRRHNRTGVLPRLDAEADAIRENIERLETLRAARDQARDSLPALNAGRDECSQKLARHDRMDAIDAKRALFAARDEAESAKRAADVYAAGLDAEGLPSDEQLARLKFASANMVTSQVAVKHSEAQLDAAKPKTGQARNALESGVFGFVSADDAKAKAESTCAECAALKSRRSPSAALIAVIAAILLAGAEAAAYFLAPSTDAGQLALTAPYIYALAAIPAAVIALIMLAVRGQSGKKHGAEAAELLARYNAADADALMRAAEEYGKLREEYDAFKADEDALAADLRAKNEALDRAADEIMAQVRLFSADIKSMNDAVAAIESAAAKRRELSELVSAADKKRLRYETLRERAPDEAPLTAEELALTRPAESRTELSARLTDLTAALQNARSRMDSLGGQMTAIGDAESLTAQLDIVNARREDVQTEYRAIAMAMEDMDSANAELQSRFSPALGARAGEILAALTGSRYDRVLLDRAMNASAEEAGSPVFRTSSLLSQGAADQLYLAVRLAICDLVLPAEKRVPLVLDDALTNFDDARMARALDYLLGAARDRQILLFTCQKREREYLQNRDDVTIISLK